MSKHVLGIDIGGTGIKGAVVDVETGALLTERHRIPTPQPATPQAVAQTVKQLVAHLNWKGPVGCTFPAVVQHGVTLSAANVDNAWIGANAEKLLEDATGLDVIVLNDADAAALGEVAFGAGKGHQGLVLMLTFGTGIGSGLILDGKLVPNTELGHLELGGHEVEPWASGKAKEEQELGFKRWTKRVNRYLKHLEMLFTPDLFIIGGGISKDWSKFGDMLEVKAEIVPAVLRNNAGIVGAALAAQAVRDGKIGAINSDLMPTSLPSSLEPQVVKALTPKPRASRVKAAQTDTMPSSEAVASESKPDLALKTPSSSELKPQKPSKTP